MSRRPARLHALASPQLGLQLAAGFEQLEAATPILQSRALIMPGIFMISGVDGQGERVCITAARPQFEIGDRKFFAEGLTNCFQLRPCLLSDLAENMTFVPGQWLLARAWPDLNVAIYCLALLPPQHRENTTAGVLAAMRVLEARGSTYAHFVLQLEQTWRDVPRTENRAAFPFDVEHRTALFF